MQLRTVIKIRCHVLTIRPTPTRYIPQAGDVAIWQILTVLRGLEIGGIVNRGRSFPALCELTDALALAAAAMIEEGRRRVRRAVVLTPDPSDYGWASRQQGSSSE